MSAPWFHLDPLPPEGERAALPSEEARHARGSRRLREGDAIVVFDGAGHYAQAKLCAVSKRTITLEIETTRRQPRHAPEIHLASALPKGDRVTTLLGMATQLGVSSFTPLSCARSVVAPGAAHAERWTRILREACKQSRRAHIPELRSAASPLEALEAPPPDTRRLLLDPDGITGAAWLAAQAAEDETPVQLLVGPEGGFSPEERAGLIERGAVAVCAADAILRIETAAVAGVTTAALLRRHE